MINSTLQFANQYRYFIGGSAFAGTLFGIKLGLKSAEGKLAAGKEVFEKFSHIKEISYQKHVADKSGILGHKTKIKLTEVAQWSAGATAAGAVVGVVVSLATHAFKNYK
ncbi:MAG: hypothetical protein SNF33_07890 [Candidatus Algichlamydia australiensis]|nr:hypothetical protein [Chlamydiales bacterium]